MLNIVVVTPEYLESESGAGLYSHALTSYLQSLGHRLHIICSLSEVVRPRFEDNGWIRVHRLACKRKNLPRSFAALAVRQVHELIELGRCDRILVVESDAFMVMYHATHYGLSSDPHPIRVAFEHDDDSLIESSDLGRERYWDKLIRLRTLTTDASKEAWVSLEQTSCSTSLDGSAA